MIFQILLTSLIVPKSQQLARLFLKNSTVNFFENFIKPQRFNDTIKGVTIYSERKDLEGNLYNLYLKKKQILKTFKLHMQKKEILEKLIIFLF